MDTTTQELAAHSRGLKVKLFSWFKSAAHSRRHHFDPCPSSSSDITLLRNSRLTSSVRSSSSRPLSTDATFLSSEGNTHLPLLELRRSVSSERYLNPHEITHSNRSFTRKEDEIRRLQARSSELISTDRRRYYALKNNDTTANKENAIPLLERKSILKSSVSSVAVSERPSSSSGSENRPSSRKSKGHITFEDEQQTLPRTSTVAILGNTMLPPSLSLSAIEGTKCQARQDQLRLPLRTIESRKQRPTRVVDPHRPSIIIPFESIDINACSSKISSAQTVQIQNDDSSRSYQNLQAYSKEFIDRTNSRCDCNAEPLGSTVIKTFCSKCQIRTKDRTSQAVRTRLLTDRRKRKNIVHYIEPDMTSSRLLLNRLVRLKNEEQDGVSADDEQSVACSCVHCFSSDFLKNRNRQQITSYFERVPFSVPCPDNRSAYHNTSSVSINMKSTAVNNKTRSNNFAQITDKRANTMYKSSLGADSSNKTKFIKRQTSDLSNEVTSKNGVYIDMVNPRANYNGHCNNSSKSLSSDGVALSTQDKNLKLDSDVEKHNSMTNQSTTSMGKSTRFDVIANQGNLASLTKLEKKLSKTEINENHLTRKSYVEKSARTNDSNYITSCTSDRQVNEADLVSATSAWYESIEDDISKGLLQETENRGTGVEGRSVSSMGVESTTLCRLVEKAVKKSIEHMLAANSLPLLSSPQRSRSLDDLRPRNGHHKNLLFYENIKSFLRGNAVSVVSEEYAQNEMSKTTGDKISVPEPLYANMWDFHSGKWGSVPDLTERIDRDNIHQSLKKQRSLDSILTPRSTITKGIDVDVDVCYKVGEPSANQTGKDCIQAADVIKELFPDICSQKLYESEKTVIEDTEEENRLSPTQSQVNNSTICSENLELIEELTRLGKGLPSKIAAVRKSPVKKIKYKAKDVLSGKAKLKLTIYKNGSLLTVHIIRAATLFSTRCHYVNCYVKVSLHPDELKRTNWRTDVIKADNNPSFNQKFSFEVLPEDKDKRLMISVWHRDIINRRSEFLGCMTFGIQHIVEETQCIRGWYRLLQESVGTRKHFAARRWICQDFLPISTKPYDVKCVEEFAEPK